LRFALSRDSLERAFRVGLASIEVDFHETMLLYHL
jgi:hypothetical protein